MLCQYTMPPSGYKTLDSQSLPAHTPYLIPHTPRLLISKRLPIRLDEYRAQVLIRRYVIVKKLFLLAFKQLAQIAPHRDPFDALAVSQCIVNGLQDGFVDGFGTYLLGGDNVCIITDCQHLV